MKIAFVSDPDAVNSNYRAYQPLSELERRGHTVFHNRAGQPQFQLDRLLSCDAVVIHRFAGPETRKAMTRLAQAGVGLVWDNDDDLANVPRTNPHYRRFGGLNRQRIVSDLGHVQRLADVVTTPSATLAERFRASGAEDVRVLENFLPVASARVSPVRHDGVVVAWLAGLEHQSDYAQLRLRETLQRLLDELPELRVLSIGLGLGLDPARYEHHPLIHFFDLATTLARADIGIAPLADTPWNQARSNVKLKEYGSAHLAWLASPVGAYTTLGEGQGGRLVGDDDWGDAIHQLVTKQRERRKLAKRAAKWAAGETIDRHVDEWEQVVVTAAERGRARR